MNDALIAAMNTYFRAGEAMNLERMNELYADDFENVRMDPQGNIVTLTKSMFMNRFRQMQAQGQSLSETSDAIFLDTNTYDHLGTVFIKRVKEGQPYLYCFTWRMQGGQPTQLVREFTFDHDVSYLVQLLKQQSK